MRAHFAVLVSGLSLSAAAGTCLPGVLGLAPGVVETMLTCALLPFFLAFLWWTW